ncbi:uncharacterized protein PGTG_12546 [Puccinia graminis f. sp. tritici CRL 75-36-700-3]|uniref:Uncharacterized protein n=1 Tax=Puccinia graminis f. sp. tritici (strain CRL 75-36-700-3 / race SCCL) TaxID=418459 RepID=E3KUZ9_PUCGT|nr:uncharacterized protein PGTG_12546 [Puccinia graminis f. sp. tritici CRL 75-36-700-3]EFP88099.2 hypothetical protein PGTG_12546 [Puccinia graminis f. sp. tritici CRL 75-36-700-3]
MATLKAVCAVPPGFKFPGPWICLSTYQATGTTSYLTNTNSDTFSSSNRIDRQILGKKPRNSSRHPNTVAEAGLSKNASGPQFCFWPVKVVSTIRKEKTTGNRLVQTRLPVGLGFVRSKGPGKMRTPAGIPLIGLLPTPYSRIKLRDMRPLPPSTNPSPGTYHSYPMSTPPTTNTGVGMNATEPIDPRFQPPPYNLNLPRFPHPVFYPHPPMFHPPGQAFPPFGQGGGPRGRGFVGGRGRGRGGGRGRGWLPPAQLRIRGQANRFYYPNGPAAGVPFGHGHAPLFNSNRAQVDMDNFLNQHPIPPAVQRRPTPIPVPSLPSVPAANVARAPSNLSSIRSGNSFYTAEDFLAPQVWVASPTPAGMYNPDDYHLLARHQIESLLDRCAAPKRFDRYEFTPQHFDNFYQSATSALFHHWTRHPAAKANERQDRVRLFQFITRQYRTMTRRVVPLRWNRLCCLSIMDSQSIGVKKY